MHGDMSTSSLSEQRRLLVLNHLQSGSLINPQAASLLGISIRQVSAPYRFRDFVLLSIGS